MYFPFHYRPINQKNCGNQDMILKCIPHGTAVQPCESCRLMGNISASWVNGFWWALLVVCESPCFAGRQDLVLPQRALTHSSANTKQHLKLWSCCPCCTFCQAALQITRENFFFLLLSTWEFPSFCPLPLNSFPPLSFRRPPTSSFLFTLSSCFVSTSTTSPNQ